MYRIISRERYEWPEIIQQADTQERWSRASAVDLEVEAARVDFEALLNWRRGAIAFGRDEGIFAAGLDLDEGTMDDSQFLRTTTDSEADL